MFKEKYLIRTVLIAPNEQSPEKRAIAESPERTEPYTSDDFLDELFEDFRSDTTEYIGAESKTKIEKDCAKYVNFSVEFEDENDFIIVWTEEGGEKKRVAFSEYVGAENAKALISYLSADLLRLRSQALRKAREDVRARAEQFEKDQLVRAEEDRMEAERMIEAHLDEGTRYEAEKRLIMGAGYSEEDVDIILTDRKNPYLDYIYRAARGEFADELRDTPDVIDLSPKPNRTKLRIALRWTKTIYPRLQKIAGSYEAELAQAIAAGGTPAMQAILLTLAYNDMLDVNQDRRLRRELRALREGKTVDEIWKEAQEERRTARTREETRETETAIGAGTEGNFSVDDTYETAEAERTAEEESFEELREEARIRNKAQEVQERKFKERRQLDELISDFREGRKDLREGDLPSFQQQLMEMMRNTAEEDERLKVELLDFQRTIEELKNQMMQLFAEEATVEEVGEIMGSEIDMELERFKRLKQEVIESGDEDMIALIYLYGEMVEDLLEGTMEAHKPRNPIDEYEKTLGSFN